MSKKYFSDTMKTLLIEAPDTKISNYHTERCSLKYYKKDKNRPKRVSLDIGKLTMQQYFKDKNCFSRLLGDPKTTNTSKSLLFEMIKSLNYESISFKLNDCDKIDRICFYGEIFIDSEKVDSIEIDNITRVISKIRISPYVEDELLNKGLQENFVYNIDDFTIDNYIDKITHVIKEHRILCEEFLELEKKKSQIKEHLRNIQL